MMGEHKGDELAGSVWDITAILINDGKGFYTGSFLPDGSDDGCLIILQSQRLKVKI